MSLESLQRLSVLRNIAMVRVIIRWLNMKGRLSWSSESIPDGEIEYCGEA